MSSFKRDSPGEGTAPSTPSFPSGGVAVSLSPFPEADTPSVGPALEAGVPEAAVHLEPGTMLGAFKVIDRLGAGGMGEVYRALDTRLGRKVALKVLPREFLSREGIARFAQEARSASALNHPNIVTIFEVGQAGTSPFLAMELIEGLTLRQLIDAGQIPLKKILDLATQIVSGLAKAHNAGIVHRDLKPENIMVTSDGFVKILDFGLAKRDRTPGLAGDAEPSVSLTQAGLVIGTPDYMSPEQAAGRVVDFRSDQFSAGVVLYEMLTRRRLFHRDTPIQTLSAIIQDDLLPLEGLPPRVPPPLRWAIERCLAKDPAERWNSTVELVLQVRQVRDKLAEFQPPADLVASAPTMAQTPAPAAPAGTPTSARPEGTASPAAAEVAPNAARAEAATSAARPGAASVARRDVTRPERSEAAAPPAISAPPPLPPTRSPIPAILSTAIPISVGSRPVAAAAPTKGRRVREFALVLVLGFAFFAAGAVLGHWFRGKQIDPPAPTWKGNLLVGPMTRVLSPRSSPDGKTLAFLTLVSGRAQVAVMKPSSGDWTVLTSRGSGSVSKVCWSRDGDRLYFDRVTDVPAGIFTVPPLGGSERVVLEDAQGPEALPDGSLLVVRRDAQRNFQVHRFYPDSGKLAPLGPAVVGERGTWSLRAFPDGKSALFWGRLAGSADPARRVYLLDLATGKAAPFAPQIPLAPPLAIAPDGSSVFAFMSFGDLQQAMSVSRDGQQVRILFPVTGKPWGMDAAADGSVFVSTMDAPGELLRFSAAGGVPDQVVTVAANLLANPVELADAGFLIPDQVLGRRRLLIRAPDGALRPFLDSAEQATPPAAVLGSSQVAFLSGAVGQPSMITIATLPEGRIVRRLEATRGIVPQSLAASPDGRTLFYVDSGSLFSVEADGGGAGSPRKLRPANGVAVDARPGEPALIVQVNENDGVKLLRVPFSGGSELPILFASSLRIAPVPISGGAVGPDGRIAVTVASPDSVFRGVGLLDPAAATLERLTVPFDGDIQSPTWGRDGSLVAVGVSLRSSLWRFQPQAVSEGR